MFFLMDSKTFIKMFSFLVTLALFGLVDVCAMQQRETACFNNVCQDPVVIIYAKMVWHMSWAFVEKVDNQFSVKTFGIHSSKKGEVWVTAEECYIKTDIDLKRADSTESLRRRAASDNMFKKVMCQIDSNFFELSNREKIKVLENTASKGRKGLSL